MSVLSFPHNIFEFQQQFATEAACLQYRLFVLASG